jgi:hypothetical protein
MNLALGKMESGKIEPSTLIPRTKIQLGGIADGVGGGLQKIKTAKNERVTQKIEQEIAEIENNYSKTRRANEFSKDVGASRKRIAETDVLDGAVDTEGIIRTKQPGGAVERYRAQKIDGYEGVVGKSIKQEGKMVNLNEVERELKLKVSDSGLEGADLVSALSGVKKEIAGLRLRADEFGNIPLFKIHEAKINTTKNINYQTPPETATYRKTVARTYKEIVEARSEVAKEANPELSKLYEDIVRLENLDGKRVRGGKLGKYFAQVSGNLIGAATGGAVGGPIGMAIGTVAGGEAAGFIKGKTMSKTFGSPGDRPSVKNPILEKAKATSEQPAKIDLTKPDIKVGVPKSFPKTKEIIQLEGRIAKNVEAQKTAIKAGDFTLVATLKDVYNALVEKLKEVINTISKERGGFARLGKDYSNNLGNRNTQ